MLLLVYSLGLGIPFLITGAAFSSATSLLRKMNRYANIVSIISGLFLLFVARCSGQIRSLAVGTIHFMSDWAIELEDWLGRVTGTNGDILSLSGMTAAPLAFLAGIISFVSPVFYPWCQPILAFEQCGCCKARLNLNRVTLYSKPGCCLCDDLKAMLQDIMDEFPVQLTERNIERDPDDFERFRYVILFWILKVAHCSIHPHNANAIRAALQQVQAHNERLFSGSKYLTPSQLLLGH